MYPTIPIGGWAEVPVYGLMFLAGTAAAILLGRKMGPQAGMPAQDILYGAIYALIGILVGAKLVYFLTKLPALLTVLPAVRESFAKDAWGTMFFLAGHLLGGFVYYGGLLGAVLGIYCYCRQFGLDFVAFMDIFAPLVPLVHGLGRVGCFFAGCCYGLEYHGPGSVWFPKNPFIPELDAVPRVPVQLLEAVLNLLFFGIMMHLFYKKNLRGGRLLGVYLLYYSVARFALELLRGDKIRGSVGIFSTSQLISLLLLPAGIALVSGKWTKWAKK